MLGYSHPYISNIETGKTPLPDKFLDKLSKAFEMDTEEYKSYNRENNVTVVDEATTEYYTKLKMEHEDLQKKYTRVLEENNALHAQLQELRQQLTATPADSKSKR